MSHGAVAAGRPAPQWHRPRQLILLPIHFIHRRGYIRQQKLSTRSQHRRSRFTWQRARGVAEDVTSQRKLGEVCDITQLSLIAENIALWSQKIKPVTPKQPKQNTSNYDRLRKKSMYYHLLDRTVIHNLSELGGSLENGTTFSTKLFGRYNYTGFVRRNSQTNSTAFL